MKVALVNPQPLLLDRVGLQEQKQNEGGSFTEIIREKLQEVNQLQLRADDLTKQFLAGGQVELHDVMLAAEKANLALQLTMQIRNKIVEAYQEVSRMQI